MATGISRATYGRLEQGRYENPPLRYLVNCAIVLNVELDDVLQDDWRTWLKLGDPMTPFRKALIGRARAAAKTTDTS